MRYICYVKQDEDGEEPTIHYQETTELSDDQVITLDNFLRNVGIISEKEEICTTEDIKE